MQPFCLITLFLFAYYDQFKVDLRVMAMKGYTTLHRLN